MKKIAIQGVPGSYHDIAAHKFFPGEEIELICCSTFEEVFANIKQDSKCNWYARYREHHCRQFAAQL